MHQFVRLAGGASSTCPYSGTFTTCPTGTTPVAGQTAVCELTGVLAGNVVLDNKATYILNGKVQVGTPLSGGNTVPATLTVPAGTLVKGKGGPSDYLVVNPGSKIFAEGLRIPPVKLWDRGRPRKDVMNLLLTNMRARRDQEGDFNALIGACQVGARNLVNLMKKYGKETVQDCIAELLDMAEAHMRKLISEVPDGTYTGTAILEDAGHGYGDFQIEATVTIKGDGCHIAIASPPQIPYFINSYEGNSHSGVYLGLMMFAQLPPPYNEGLYRCVTTDMGPKGTLCNAKSPAPHMNCTTTPMETLTDAVRLAFEQAAPHKVSASWGHANGCNVAGWDTRHDEEYVTMVLASIISGAGATAQADGWQKVMAPIVWDKLTVDGQGDAHLLV